MKLEVAIGSLPLLPASRGTLVPMKLLAHCGGRFCLLAKSVQICPLFEPTYRCTRSVPQSGFSPASGGELDIRKRTPLHTPGHLLPYSPSFRVMMHTPSGTNNLGAWLGAYLPALSVDVTPLSRFSFPMLQFASRCSILALV